MKHFFITVLAVMCGMSCGYANDGVYFTSGSFLVPVAETDIAVAKEVLTVTVGKDGFARVDVCYELFNSDRDKTVTMAFEAMPPYNTMEPLRREGGHPYIHDFTVTMNGHPLEYTTGLAAIGTAGDGHVTDFTPLDTSMWKGVGEVDEDIVPYEDAIYSPGLDSLTAFAYAYYFPARFLHGKNIVHHTYRYRMSYNVACRIDIPYSLTPVTRWANGKVDDFTLRIKTEEPLDLCLDATLFAGAPFTVAEGRGSLHQLDAGYMGRMIFASLSGGAVVEWHAKDFSPKEEMEIMSADILLPDTRWMTSATVVVMPDGSVSRYVGDCGGTYLVMAQDYHEVPKQGAHVTEYSAEKGQGVVFAGDNGRIDVHRLPSENSGKVGTIAVAMGDMPETFRCLGHENGWYRLRFGNIEGYVRDDLMQWSPVPVR